MKKNQSKSFARRCEFSLLETRQMQAVDLAITAVSVGTRITSAGQGFDIAYTVKNYGSTATSGTTFIRNYLSEDKKLGNADDIGLDTGYYKPSIPAGGSATFVVKSGTGISQDPGYFRVCGVVDPQGYVDESNESNNWIMSDRSALIIAKFLDNDNVVGTSGNDKIELSVVSSRAIIVVNGEAFSRPVGYFGNYLSIDTGAGKDRIVATEDFSVPLNINTGSGNDSVFSGAKADVIKTGGGHDQVHGRAGYDFIEGGAGNDKLFGDVGRDSVYGGSGNDTVDAGTGTDLLYGGAGKDVLVAADGTADYRDSLWGGSGKDKYYADDQDILDSVETKLN